MECNMTSTFSVGKAGIFAMKYYLTEQVHAPSSSYAVHYLTLPHVRQEIKIHVYYKTPFLQHSLPLRNGNLHIYDYML